MLPVPQGSGITALCTLQAFLIRSGGQKKCGRLFFFFLSCQRATSLLFAFLCPFQPKKPVSFSTWCAIFCKMKLNLSVSSQLLMNKQIGLKRYEVDGRKVLFYFDEVMNLFLVITPRFRRAGGCTWIQCTAAGGHLQWELRCSCSRRVAWASSEVGRCCGFGWEPRHQGGGCSASAHTESPARYHLVLTPK